MKALLLSPPVVIGFILFWKLKVSNSMSWGDAFWGTAFGVSIAATSVGLMFSQFNNGITRVGGGVAVSAVNEVGSNAGVTTGASGSDDGAAKGAAAGGAAIGGQATGNATGR